VADEKAVKCTAICLCASDKLDC